MQRLLSLFLLIGFVGISQSIECKGKPDGFYEISCLSMSKCTNGVITRILCPRDQVVDTDTHECKPIKDVASICGKKINCEGKADGTYADFENKCRSYYTCLAGHFLGHNLCPNDLVYNEKLKLCDFKGNVKGMCA